MTDSKKAKALLDLIGKKFGVSLKDRLEIIWLDKTESTNAVAKSLAANDAKEGTLVIAECQTCGRGRLGRSFFSPVGGLYMSLLLKPRFSADTSTLITVAAAVAVASAIEKLSGKKCDIKWVNDVYTDGKKVCGILTEGAVSSNTANLDFAVLGMGINLQKPENGFPDEIKDIADALFEKPVQNDVKTELVADILGSFFTYYDKLEERAFLDEYKRRSFIIGKIVSYEKSGILHTATVTDIDNSARLVTEENGKTVTLSAGEVSIKPKK